ncbi:MAG: hypothetical protein D6722_20925 [Bacteroidetes bacterium]|nr:MAG: hypothetical protein D6722_20925 [Bacteroidota bacterium]
MRHLLPFLTLLFGMALPASAQQALSLHFAPRAMQAQETNPAFFNEKLITISLPSPYVSVLHSGFTYRDLIQPVGDSLRLDIPGALSQMEEMNDLRLFSQVDILGIGVKLAMFQVTAGARARTDVLVSYPRDLVALGWEGNAAHLDETLSLGPTGYARAWSEIYLGGAIRVTKKIQIGARAKYLVGLADATFTRHDLTLYTNPEIYQLEARADYVLHTSVLNLGQDLSSPDFVFEPQVFGPNRGWAVDLGLRVQPIKQLELAASLTDLGFIDWNAQSQRYEATGTLAFAGLDAAQLLDEDSLSMDFIDELADSLLQGMELRSSPDMYRTYLPAKAYVSATFRPIKLLKVGVLYHAESYGGRTRQALAVHGGVDVGKILNTGLTWSLQDGRAGHLGAHAYLKLGPAALLLATDNVLAFIQPDRARTTNARLGLNLCF